jgi:hypothetical protein
MKHGVMKNIISLLLMLSVSFTAVAQKNNSTDNNKGEKQNTTVINKDSTKEDQGTKEADDQDTLKVKLKTSDTKITPGASGVKRSIGYKFSSIREDSAPGNGLFRFNSDTVSYVKWIYVDDNDIKGEDQTQWYSTWDDSTGATGRGQLIIVENESEDINTSINVFDITDVFIDADGYWKFPVSYVSGTSLRDGFTYYYVFKRIANSKVKEKENRGDEVAEKKVEEAPVVTEAPKVEVVTEVPVTEVVAEAPPAPVVTEAPKVEVVTEVPVTEVVAEAPPAPVVTEAPKVEVVTEYPVTEVVAEAPPAPVVAENPKVEVVPKVDQGDQGNQGNQSQRRIEESGNKTVQNAPPAEPPRAAQNTTVAQGPPRVTENRPSRVTTVAQGSQTVPATKPAQGTQSTTVAQSTKTVPVTQPIPETRVNEVPMTQSYTGSSGTGHGKCYRGIIEIGYALRVSEYGMNNFRFNFINGFNIGHTSIGLGIGVRKYYDKPSRHSDWHLVSSDVQIPVFLDVRTTFSGKKITPYLGLGIGNSEGADTAKNKPEGLYLHGTGGIWFNISDRFALFGGFAYELQRLEYANFSDEITYKRYTNSISLNIGIAF